MKLSKARKYFLVFILAMMFSSAYLLPYIKYVFYEELKLGLNATNQQVGFLLTIYAVMNTLTLIPGGWISDKYNAKKIIVISSVVTGLLNLCLAFVMDYKVALVIWALLGFSTIFAFWGAIIKSVRLLGDESEQGRLYGFYAGFQGLINTFCAFGASFILSMFVSKVTGFRGVLIFYGIMCIGSALLFQIFYPKELEEKDKKETSTNQINLKTILVVLKMPQTWILSVIIFSIYSVFSGSTYLTPYVSNVVGITGVLGSIIAIFRTYVARAIFAPVGGIVVDKNKQTTKSILGISVLSGLMFVLLWMFGQNASNLITFIIIIASAIFIYMNFGIMWAIAEDIHIPRHLYGTVIGVASIIGYAPDLFIHTLFGAWLDKYGNGGYNYIFLTLAFFAFVGAVVAAITLSMKDKFKKNA